MKKPTIRQTSVALVITVALIGIGLGFSHRTISSTRTDPTGEFTAIVSYRSHLSHLAMAPGQSGDKPCSVRIVDSKGRNRGEIPVFTLWMADDLEWKPNGASIKMTGEWDFEKNTCYYYSDDREQREIHVDVEREENSL